MSRFDARKDNHPDGYIHDGDPGIWCPHLWSWVVDKFEVKSVLEIGCGEGHVTRFFQGLGCRVDGVIPDRSARKNDPAIESLHPHDFSHGPYKAEEAVDMVWSCAFLDRIAQEHVPNVLATCAAAGKVILIAHATPGEEDDQHVNCQPSSYWIRQIEPLGFRCDVDLSREGRKITLRDYPGVNRFARSGLVFVRTNSSASPEKATSVFSGMRIGFDARYRAFRINQGFRWSIEFQEHMRKCKSQL